MPSTQLDKHRGSIYCIRKLEEPYFYHAELANNEKNAIFAGEKIKLKDWYKRKQMPSSTAALEEFSSLERDKTTFTFDVKVFRRLTQ